ncbi:hypothetical protein COY88_04330 [Candidatus Roizmanbacteria bacterium CG_4_10_14_0_8_um_filter_35_28]|uniref:Coenzyme F420:L-glutamate ligase-like domain-containing protein n=1 Tax=Candidatus Roizmanbacteria bacterium CG_4_10_14_0_8_um_filter_35_28 TaxID=1974827 RepID=A0A2M7QF95_9BACT|nr:MAG: hypothetical protein COY88_04330 [Candidatus Roizmanbacteria bacterium CG_4_10_14_0_8_um_filter_35_28]
MKFHKEIIFLGDIVNYSLKGLTAALGKGEGITKFVRPISYHIDMDSKLSNLIEAIAATNLLRNGDVIVIPSKVISILEKRFVYGLTTENYQRCINDINFARKILKVPDKDPIIKRDQIGLDKIDPKKGIGVRYPKDPNFSCYTIAKNIKDKLGVRVDVVISDSDSGSTKGIALIGCPTIIATPIGATKGLRLFYCMRVAIAAETTWNNIENIPILLVQPPQNYAVRIRKNIGELRYKGFLNAKREKDIISILEKK